MNKVIVTLEGGIVQNITADDDNIEVVVLDFDTEGCTCEDDDCVLSPDGHEVFCSDWIPNVDPKWVEQQFYHYGL